MNKQEIKYKVLIAGLIKGDLDKTIDELESLNSKNKLNVTDIVNYAQNKKTELHKSFEWNDEKCAFNYRKQQARSILNAIGYDAFEIDERTGKKIAVIESAPLYESVKTDDKGKREYVNQIKTVKNSGVDREALRMLQNSIETYMQQAVRKQQQYNQLIEYFLDR